MGSLEGPPKQPKTTVVQLRLDDDAKMKLSQYAEFLGCSPSYVVTEALKLVYHKDKEFQSWLSDRYSNNREPILKGVSHTPAVPSRAGEDARNHHVSLVKMPSSPNVFEISDIQEDETVASPGRRSECNDLTLR